MSRIKVITNTAEYEVTERGDVEVDASAVVGDTPLGYSYVQLKLDNIYRTFKYEGEISDANGVLLWEYRDMHNPGKWLRVYND